MSRKDIVKVSRYLTWFALTFFGAIGLMALIWVGRFLVAHHVILFGYLY